MSIKSTIKNDKKIISFLNEFKRIRKEIATVEPFRKGSIIERKQICGNKNCRCRKNKKYLHGPYYSWTTKELKKTQTIIVPPELINEANEYLENAQIMQTKIKQLTKISDDIFRRKVELIRNQRNRK